MHNVDNKFRKSSIITKGMYALNILCAEIVCLFKKTTSNQRYWLFGAGDDIYANNISAFFEYVKKYHPEITPMWVCDKDSLADLSVHIPMENIIIRRTVRNYIIAKCAEAGVYCFSDRDIAPGYYRIAKRKSVLVNISHGFDGLKGMPDDYYKQMPSDIIIAASEYEKNIKIQYCGADPEKVRTTGFARFDKWETPANTRRETNVLIMPTWRDWYEESDIVWNDTKVYRAYDELFDKMNDTAKKSEMTFTYKFHPRMKLFYRDAKWNEFENVTEADDSLSVQELLKQTDVLITDYSSVFWDSLYMKKPAILFWADYEEYKERRGLLAEHGFYPFIFMESDGLIKCLESIIGTDNNKLDFPGIRDKYFDWDDKSNCSRIFEAINKTIVNRSKNI